MSGAVEGVAPTLEQVEDWLVANCGKGLPYGEAKDRAGMLHGLAYVLRQIEGTDSYKVNIGQCNSATSALRMALEHFAREALTTPPARSYADEDVARIIDPWAWQERERLLVRKAEWEARPVIEGVDFVTIYARDADSQVAPSLAKAAAIRLLSQGGKA